MINPEIPNDQQIADYVMKVWDDFEQSQARDVFTKAAICYAFLDGIQDANYLKPEVLEESLRVRREVKKETYLYFNKYKDYYMQWGSLLKPGIPKYVCEASDPTDPKAKETGRIVTGLHKYHKDYVWNFDTAIYSRLFFDDFCGGQVYHFYHPGKPNNRRAPGKKPKSIVDCKTLPVFSVAYDGTIETSMQDATVVVIEQKMSLADAKAMFPKQEKAIDAFFKDTPIKDNVSLTRQNQYLTMTGVTFTEERKDSLDPDDQEYIFYIGLKSPSKYWPNGKKWLIIDDRMVCEEDLDGGVLPIEVVSTQEFMPGCKLRTPPGWAGISAQVAWNDMQNLLLKEAALQADPPTFRFEDTIISDKDKNKFNNTLALVPGQGYTIRPNPKLFGQGIGPKDQIPFRQYPTSSGIALPMVQQMENMFASLLHINADMGQNIPSGTPAELLKTQYTVVKEKLTQIQTLLEDSLSRSWIIASTLMQSVLVPGDTFTIIGADGAETLEWKNENLTEGVNHIFRSQINEPTSKEAKLQYWQTLISIFGESIIANLDKEDFYRIMDMDGLSIQGARDPEIQQAEKVNRRILNGEIEEAGKTEYGGATIIKWKVKGFTPLMEHNKPLRLKVHSELKRGDLWQTMTKDQQDCLDEICREYISLLWIEQNKMGGMFGMLPRAEFDAMMWKAMGVPISPEDEMAMQQTGMTYKELQSAKLQMAPPPGEPGQPGQPGSEAPPAPADPLNTELTTETTIEE